MCSEIYKVCTGILGEGEITLFSAQQWGLLNDMNVSLPLHTPTVFPSYFK